MTQRPFFFIRLSSLDFSAFGLFQKNVVFGVFVFFSFFLSDLQKLLSILFLAHSRSRLAAATAATTAAATTAAATAATTAATSSATTTAAAAFFQQMQQSFNIYDRCFQEFNSLLDSKSKKNWSGSKVDRVNILK